MVNRPLFNKFALTCKAIHVRLLMGLLALLGANSSSYSVNYLPGWVPGHLKVNIKVIGANYLPISNQIITLVVDSSVPRAVPFYSIQLVTDASGNAEHLFDMRQYPSMVDSATGKLMPRYKVIFSYDSCGGQVVSDTSKFIFNYPYPPPQPVEGWLVLELNSCRMGQFPCVPGFRIEQNGQSVRLTPYQLFPTYKSIWRWKLGDGFTSNFPIINHHYHKAGTYTIELESIDSSYNCNVAFSQQVVIPQVTQPQDSMPIRFEFSHQTFNGLPTIGEIYAIEIYPDSTCGQQIGKIYSKKISNSLNLVPFPSLTLAKSTLMLPFGMYIFKFVPTKHLNNQFSLLDSYIEPFEYNSHSNHQLLWRNAFPVAVNPFWDTLKACDVPIHGMWISNGPGSVQGRLIQGSNKGRVVSAPALCPVLLIDDYNQVLIQTLADSSGVFTFGNLHYGKYRIYADVAGLNADPVTVEINPSNFSLTGVDIELYRCSKTTSRESATPAVLTTQPAYPNPAISTLTWPIVSQLGYAAEAQVEVLNVEGRVVQQQAATLSPNGETQVQLSVTNLPAGLYLARLTQGGATLATTRFVKGE